MAGPAFDIILSLSKDVTPEHFAMVIMRESVEHGYGVLFGKEVLRSLDPSEAALLDRLETKMPNALVFSVTSNPLATNALQIFERQLNPWNGADPTKADILGYLGGIWKRREVMSAIFVILDFMIPSRTEMTIRDLDFEGFLGVLMNYYKTKREGEGGEEGVFRIEKSPHKASH